MSVLCRGFFEKPMPLWNGGVWQMLTSSGGSLNADSCWQGGGGDKICQNLADVICERSHTLQDSNHLNLNQTSYDIYRNFYTSNTYQPSEIQIKGYIKNYVLIQSTSQCKSSTPPLILYARYLCSRNTLGLKASQARCSTIGYLTILYTTINISTHLFLRSIKSWTILIYPYLRLHWWISQ